MIFETHKSHEIFLFLIKQLNQAHSHSIISCALQPAWILGLARLSLGNTVTDTVKNARLSIHAGFRAML
jgi:hypothetical protein